MRREQEAFPGVGEPLLEVLGGPSPTADAQQEELGRVHHPDHVCGHLEGHPLTQAALGRQVRGEGAHVADPARVQLVRQRLQVGISLGAIAEHREQGGHPFIEQPDGVREQVEGTVGVRLGPNLPHDVALQGGHRLLGPGQGDLDQEPE